MRKLAFLFFVPLISLAQPASCFAKREINTLAFYRKNNSITVLSCFDTCERMAYKNNVPLESFEKFMRTHFSLTEDDRLRAITTDEVSAYTWSNATLDQAHTEHEKPILRKFDKLQSVFNVQSKNRPDEYSSSALEASIESAKNELYTLKEAASGVARVNELLAQHIRNLLNDGRESIHEFHSSRAEDQFLYHFLEQFDASRPECGAKNCHTLHFSTKTSKTGVKWNLVSRKRSKDTGRFYDVWQDSKTNLLWTNPLDEQYTHTAAAVMHPNGKLTTNTNVLKELACVDAQGKRARANINDRKFALPTIEEYRQAEADGIREVQSLEGRWFWTSTLEPYNSDAAREYNGTYGYYDIRHVDYKYDWILCVGR